MYSLDHLCGEIGTVRDWEWIENQCTPKCTPVVPVLEMPEHSEMRFLLPNTMQVWYDTHHLHQTAIRGRDIEYFLRPLFLLTGEHSDENIDPTMLVLVPVRFETIRLVYPKSEL